MGFIASSQAEQAGGDAEIDSGVLATFLFGQFILLQGFGIVLLLHQGVTLFCRRLEAAFDNPGDY